MNRLDGRVNRLMTQLENQLRATYKQRLQESSAKRVVLLSKLSPGNLSRYKSFCKMRLEKERCEHLASLSIEGLRDRRKKLESILINCSPITQIKDRIKRLDQDETENFLNQLERNEQQ